MIDSFTKLLSGLTKLVEAREKNREKFVARYVEPVYRDAESIYIDYSSLLREIRAKVKRGKKIAPILKYLKEKRQENLPTRTKVRALLKNRLDQKKLTRFERGIWGLMMGSVTAFDKGHCSFQPIFWGDHTILDVADYFSSCEGETYITQEIRRKMLNFVGRQIDGIDHAWSEVVAGYADLGAVAIPNSGLPKSKIYKPEGN